MVMLENGLSEAMNAKIIGAGNEVIILGHGYGGDQSVWDKLLPHLSKTHRVVVFDWLFSGSAKDPNMFDPQNYSSYDAFASDLLALIDEMKLQTPTSTLTFVGHSMSGMIGCITSIKRPELFKRLILIGASPRYLNAENYEGGFNDSEIDDILTNIESNFHNWATHFASMAMDPKDLISVNKFEKSLRSMRPDVALSLGKTVFCGDYRDILNKVNVPCTIVQTANDIVVPNSVAEYMVKNIKGKSTAEIIECDGHFPHLTAHIQLLDVLGNVLGFECLAGEEI